MLCDSELSVINVNKDDKNERVFDYTLNKKRAKAKLLRGAKKDKNLDIDIKPGCVNLRFDNGSYYQVVLPWLRELSIKACQTVRIGDVEVKVIEVHAGKENTGNHVDTQLVVMEGNNRLVLHAYNSTQNLMIQGKSYDHFALNVLEPFFSKLIEESLEKISNFNTKVQENLAPKRSLKLKTKKPCKCPQCNIVSKTPGDLRIHMKKCHTKPSITPAKQTKILKVLNEDTSMVLDDQILDIEMKNNSSIEIINQPSFFLPLVEDLIHCNKCDFDTLLQEDLNLHMSVTHGQDVSSDKEVDESLSHRKVPDLKPIVEEMKLTVQEKVPAPESTNCEVDKEGNKDLNVHVLPVHVEAPNFKCNKCEFTAAKEEDRLVHFQTTHMISRVELSPIAIKCDQCEYRCRYTIQLKKHIAKEHKTYKYKECDFSTFFVADCWEHTVTAHPDESDKESDKNDIVLKIVAE